MRKYLCFILAFLLAAPPVWAKAPRVRAAVVEFQNPYFPQADLNAFGLDVEKNLRKNGFEMSPRVSVVQGLNRFFQKKSGHDLSGILAQAKEDFYRFNFGRIQATLGSEVRRVESGQCLPTDVDLMPEAWVVMGQVALAQNRQLEAQNYFHQALVANPNLNLSDEEYAPQVMSLWTKTQQALEQEKGKKGQVTVVSNPDEADVTVDGVSVGKSPMKLGRLMPGRHLIGVSKEGFESACAVVIADSKKSLKSQINLVAALSTNPQKIVVGKPLEQWAPALAHILGVDYLILLGDRKAAKTMAASFQTYDTRLAQLMPLEVGDEAAIHASTQRWADLLNGVQLVQSDADEQPQAKEPEAKEAKEAKVNEARPAKIAPDSGDVPHKKTGKKIALIAGGVLLLGGAAGAVMALGGGGSSGPKGPRVAVNVGSQ